MRAAEEAEDEDAAAPLYEEGDRVGEALDALAANLMVYAPETVAASGAVVTLDHEGAIVVHRRLVRPEDAKAIAKSNTSTAVQAGGGEDENGEAKPGKTLSERLVRNLSAHRTAALQAEVAAKPDVALAVLVHRLALTVFYHGGDSLLQITVYPQDGLHRHAPELTQSKAQAAFDTLRSAWRERLPADGADLFDAVRDMKRADVLALLAVCVAGTLDAVVRDQHDTRADSLAQAVRLEMNGYWQPSGEAYFNNVSKALILDGIKTFKPTEFNRIAGYKKADMAREAGEHAIAAKWLPDMLCTA